MSEDKTLDRFGREIHGGEGVGGMEWERVHSGREFDTYRLAVPNGWLYMCAGTMCFVPYKLV